MTDGEKEEAEGRRVCAEADMRALVVKALVVNDTKVLRLTVEWSLARAYRLDARRAMEACGRCEFAERGDYDAGDQGRAKCYQLWSIAGDPEDGWCPPCIQRQPLFKEMLERKRVERRAFYRLCRLLDRSVKATNEAAVDPP